MGASVLLMILAKDFSLFAKKTDTNVKKRSRSSKMSLSEGMAIQVLFHLSGCRTFKGFYLGYVPNTFKKIFPTLCPITE